MLDSCGTTTSCTMTYGRVQWRLSAPEGRLLIRRHKSRERDKGLRKRKIDAVLRQGRRAPWPTPGELRNLIQGTTNRTTAQ
ncbi:hypothetical protein GCM10010304_59550 [Streptomyces roseoviolaceus]